MKFNINEQVVITLLERGKAILIADAAWPREQSIGEMMLDAMYPGWQSGKVKMQMWEAMRVFGPHMGMGLDTPIDTNIELLISEAK